MTKVGDEEGTSLEEKKKKKEKEEENGKAFYCQRSLNGTGFVTVTLLKTGKNDATTRYTIHTENT